MLLHFHIKAIMCTVGFVSECAIFYQFFLCFFNTCAQPAKAPHSVRLILYPKTLQGDFSMLCLP